MFHPHGSRPAGEHGRHAAGEHGEYGEQEHGEFGEHGQHGGTGHADPVTGAEAHAGEQTRATEAGRTGEATRDNHDFLDTLIDHQGGEHPGEEDFEPELIDEHKHVSYEGEEHFQESMNELYLAEHLRPEERDLKRFKEEFTAIEKQFYLTKITDKGPELNTDGYKIEAVDAVKLLSDPHYADCVRVLDLRDPKKWSENQDDYGSKIKGAIEFPLTEDFGPAGMGKIDKYGGYEPILGDTPSMAQRNQERDPARLETWRQEIAHPSSPFRKIAAHSIILVHCMYSSNRTPRFATGLVRYFARPNGQTVVILTGGFSAFKTAALAAGRPELLESRDRKNYP